MRILSKVKQHFVSPGGSRRIVRAGLFKGIILNLDLSYQTQIYWGIAERELAGYFHVFSNGIRTALDIGAAEGIYSLFWLTKTSVEKVIAFEPSEPERQRMILNLELNGLAGSERIEIIPKFVGSENNEQFCTLDSFLPRIVAPCLIKLDIEGAEVDALHHANKLLAQQDVRWIIEDHALDLENRCLAILKEANYKTKVISRAWWRIFLPEHRPLVHNRWIVAWRE